MIQVIEKEKFLGIYSVLGKKILDKSNGVLYNGYEKYPVYVDKTRYCNGDYSECNINCDSLEEKEEEKPKSNVTFPFVKK